MGPFDLLIKGVVTRPSPHPEMTKNVSGHGVSLGPFRLFFIGVF
jgi:hypothetical protein